MKKVGLLVLLFSLGCAHRPPKTNIAVSLTDSDHSVRISGFDKAIIDDIGRNTANHVWESLLPVYGMPGDTDMKDFQNAQPGKYKIVDSAVIFTPDTAFKKGQVYFVRWYQYDKIEDAWQYIRKKKRTGSLSYKDLLFTY
jgi:hypothetical protein